MSNRGIWGIHSKLIARLHAEVANGEPGVKNAEAEQDHTAVKRRKRVTLAMTGASGAPTRCD